MTFICGLRPIAMNEEIVRDIVMSTVSFFNEDILIFEDEWFLNHLGRSNVIGKLFIEQLCIEALHKGDIIFN